MAFTDTITLQVQCHFGCETEVILEVEFLALAKTVEISDVRVKERRSLSGCSGCSVSVSRP